MLKHSIRLHVSLLLFSLAIPLSLHAIVRPIGFPVLGEHSFRNDFFEPRGGGTREHLGIDILADKMTPVLAVVDGEVSYVVSPQASWGYSISIRDESGYQYRYLHINNDTPGTDDGRGGEAHAYAPGMARGVHVTRGQVIGWVGDSGNAEHTSPHLHFEIRDPNRVPINPYESLLAAKTSDTVRASSTTIELAKVTFTAGSEESFRHVFTKTLMRGSSGEDVRQLQIILQSLGYFNYPTITGYFGVVTHQAAVNFQRAEKIDPIGIVGPRTRAVLNGI